MGTMKPMFRTARYVPLVLSAFCLATAAKVLWNASVSQAQGEKPGVRVCQTPDCLSVGNVHSAKGLVKSTGILDTRLHLYIYVPRTTTQFSLGIFDQPDDTAGARPSSFELQAPDGTLVRTLDAPQSRAWADYDIATQERAGVWRLSVTGPEDQEAKSVKARNDFMVRTRGEVDLYLKPEPVMRVRGLRLSEPRFGGEPTHRFRVQFLHATRLRFNFLWPLAMTAQPTLEGAGSTLQASWHGLEQRDDRLDKALTLRFLETPNSKPGWGRLTVSDVRGIYGLGCEQEARLFFHATPLMPALRRVRVQVVDERNRGIAARLDSAPAHSALENNTVYTDADGRGELWIWPESLGRVQISRGQEWESQSLPIDASTSALKVLLKRRIQTPIGWFSGDNHMHTLWYDGTHTPTQMAEAARAAALDWITLTEHGHSEQIERAERANAEAQSHNQPGRFVVIPGMEYTGPQFHANVLGGVVRVPPNSSLQTVMEAALQSDKTNAPIAFKLNHPTLGKTAANEARLQTRLPMIELWNSDEPAATQLWWDLLNKGLRTVAETSSDSHHRQNLPLGQRRTYVYLGPQKLTQANIIRALREGRSVLSRGAFLNFAINDRRPGDSVHARQLTCRVEVQSARPIESVQIVGDGKIVQTWKAGGQLKFSTQTKLPIAGWYLAQATERGAKEPLAMSNPIWISKDNR